MPDMRPRFAALAVAALIVRLSAGYLIVGRLMTPPPTPIAREPSPTASSRSASPSQSQSPSATPLPSPRPTQTPKPRASPKPTSAPRNTVNRTSIALVATYDVAVSLNYGTRALRVNETINVRNASGGSIDHLELNTVTARIGALRLRSVTVGGIAIQARIEDQTIVVPFDQTLLNGASTRIGLAFSATLRADLAGSNWLFTRFNGIVDANRWLPWISLPRPFDRPNNGDPFFTASSPRVTVRITTDRTLVIATTGDRIGSSGLSQTFEARNVRDFNFTASPAYRVSEARVGATTVRLYSTSGYPASTVLSYATDALARMGKLVGTYPYATFTVAQSAGGYGMESPQMIWIQGGLSGNQLKWLVYHETEHQWFYGLVGSDEAYQPFADEGAGDHLARTVSGVWRSSNCSSGRLDLSIYQYSSACYFETIYVQGAILLQQVHHRMGDTAYWRATRDYVAARRFGIGSTAALLNNLQAHTTVNLRPILAPRFPSLY